MNLIDCHNHSNFSFDAISSVEAMVRAAKTQSIQVFAITDHCEINEFAERNHPNPIMDGIAEVIRLRELDEYRDITLIAGVEVGQMMFDKKLTQSIVNLDGLDFVIGSLHCVNGMPDYYFIDFTQMSTKEVESLNRKYFAEMLDIVKNGNFDVLAHITYPFRYMRNAMNKQAGLHFSFELYDEQIFELLRATAARGKGLEMNVAQLLADGERELNLKFLRQFFELGGEHISVGSDAHDADAVGLLTKMGHEVVVEAGFKYTTYYSKRKPIMIKID